MKNHKGSDSDRPVPAGSGERESGRPKRAFGGVRDGKHRHVVDKVTRRCLHAGHGKLCRQRRRASGMAAAPVVSVQRLAVMALVVGARVMMACLIVCRTKGVVVRVIDFIGPDSGVRMREDRSLCTWQAQRRHGRCRPLQRQHCHQKDQ